MKAVCIADVHLHPFRECSKDSGQDRLHDGLSAVRQSLECARKRQAKWIMLGDLKHLRTMWHQGALNGMLALLEEYAEVSKWMIPGNHDGIADGSSGLTPFRKYAEVIEEPFINPNGIAFWPWQRNFDQLTKFVSTVRKIGGKSILFAHAFISGSRVGPHDLRLKEPGVPLEKFGLSKESRVFKWAVFGDVHKAQLLAPGCYYVGSPLALNWGELEDNKGVLFVDTQQNVVEMIRIEAPRFQVLEWKDHRASVHRKGARGDFVRLIVDETVKSKDIERVREESHARYFQVVMRRQTRSEQRTDVHAGMTERELLKSYMSARPIDGLDPQDVLKAGLALLK